jgi:hypothetical protein
LRLNVPARIIALGIFFWLIVLGCRTVDLIAQDFPTATKTVIVTRTVTVRPTFTPAPPTLPPTDTPPPQVAVQVPTTPLIVPTRAPTARPFTRAPTAYRSPIPAPLAPTADLFGGFYYRPVNKGCVDATNTRIQGTVTDGGVLKNGVRIRVSDSDQGADTYGFGDFISGNDPSDPHHNCPECAGKYRISPSEGSRVDGNWWVFVIDNGGNSLSKGTFIHTQDGPGCNTATIDFVH